MWPPQAITCRKVCNCCPSAGRDLLWRERSQQPHHGQRTLARGSGPVCPGAGGSASRLWNRVWTWALQLPPDRTQKGKRMQASVCASAPTALPLPSVLFLARPPLITVDVHLSAVFPNAHIKNALNKTESTIPRWESLSSGFKGLLLFLIMCVCLICTRECSALGSLKRASYPVVVSLLPSSWVLGTGSFRELPNLGPL